jgi:hypothetical protein
MFKITDSVHRKGHLGALSVQQALAVIQLHQILLQSAKVIGDASVRIA